MQYFKAGGISFKCSKIKGSRACVRHFNRRSVPDVSAQCLSINLFHGIPIVGILYDAKRVILTRPTHRVCLQMQGHN